jgi:ATP-dependent DNA helicase RecG
MDPQVDLEDLLQREDDSVEWKKTGSPEEIVRKLSAFANRLRPHSKGGWVLCGVEEATDEHGFPHGQPVGLDASTLKKQKGTVLDSCLQYVSPPLTPSTREWPLPDDPSRRILGFYIPPSDQAHSFQTPKGTKYWVMSDSRTVEARGENLRKLLSEKGAAPPYLNRPCLRATMEDLNLLAAEEFVREAHLPRPAADYLEPDARLDVFAYPLVVSVAEAPDVSRPVPTYLALLLFGREPTRFLLGAYAILTAYDGTSPSAAHSLRFDVADPLPKLIRDLLGRLRLYTGIEIDKSASALHQRQNRPRYSEKALQEVLVNAFAHRDYESHEPVRITVFDNRIEVSNPGGLLPDIDLERLRRGDSASPQWRNPALARFLLLMNLAQSLGQGIPTIYQETVSIAEREPELISGENSFTVVLPAPEPGPEILEGDPTEDGLILVTIGAESVRPVVTESLGRLGLQGASVLVDLDIPKYVQPGAWEKEARKIRNRINRWVEDPRFKRLHLFYRGPVVLAPLLGALIAPVKPLVVYYFEGGRYERAYTLERRFLRSTED